MKFTACKKTATRRSFLNGTGAIGLVGIMLPVETSVDDCELIKVCNEIMRLDDQINSFPGRTIEQELESERLRQPLLDMQEPLFGRVCDLKARTLDGLRARARVILTWTPDVATYDGDNTELMIAALLRDILAE